MKIPFMILPLLFTFIVAYKLNAKLKGTRNERILLSLYEGLNVSVIGLLFFNARFFNIAINLLLIFVALFMMLFRLWSDELINADEDLKIETTKNTLILFVIAYVPLLVSLTMLRYTPYYIQIPISIITAGLIAIITFKIQKHSTSKLNHLIDAYNNADWQKYIYVWIGLIMLAALYGSFQIPTDYLKENLHLSNQSNFFDSVGLPYNTQNNFEQEILLQVETTSSLTINDYTYNEDTLYVLYGNKTITIYNRDNQEELDSITHNEPFISLLSYENEIYVTTSYPDGYETIDTLYKISGSTLVPILIEDSIRGYFYDGDLLHYYRLNDDAMFYEIYQITNDTSTLVDSIDVSTLQNNELMISNDTLFIQSRNTLEVYNHPDLVFDFIDETYFYDVLSQTLYQGKASIVDYETYYISENYSSGYSDVAEFSLSGIYVSLPLAHDGVVYYVNKPSTFFLSEGEHVLINNKNTGIDTIFIHSGKDYFNKWNDYTTTVTDYRIGEMGLEFIQNDQRNGQSFVTIYQLVEQDVDLALPFYSYFGMGTIYIILIAMFIPITNHSSTIMVIGGKQSLNIKKSAD